MKSKIVLLALIPVIGMSVALAAGFYKTSASAKKAPITTDFTNAGEAAQSVWQAFAAPAAMAVTTPNQSRSDVRPTTKPGKQPSPNVSSAAPSNDNCADAVVVSSCPFTDTKDTSGASDEIGEPQSACTTQGKSVWYTYTNNAAQPAIVNVDSCGSNFDTALMVWKVNGGPCDFADFTAVTCNDDFCGDGFQSSANFTADAGATYQIQVGGFSGETGNLAVNVTCQVLNCDPVVIDGTLGSGAPGFPGVQSSGLQTGRFDRNGIASSCAAPKVCSIFDPTGLRAYDAYQLHNDSGQNQCVLINLTEGAAGTCNIQSNAYLNTYDPSNICTGYLGDAGLSTGVPPTPTNLSVVVPAGQTLIVVVHTTNPGETGCAYTLTVLGDLCSAGADLSVGLNAVPSPVLAGNDIAYRVIVTNSGPASATNVTLTEATPTNTTFQSLDAPPGWNCMTPIVGATGAITCTNPNLAPGASVLFTVVVQVNPSTPPGTAISFTANVTSATSDVNLSNNSATATVNVNSQADLSIIQSDSPDPVTSGNNITYTITISNAGPSAATVVKLSDNIPAGTSFVSLNSSGSCTTPPMGGTGAITCVYASLAPGASVTSMLVVSVSSPPGSSIMNTATVSSTTTEANPANDTVTITTTVAGGSCTITCPANITVNSSPSLCGATVDYPAPNTNGGCGQVTCAPPSGAFFPRGSTNVTCTPTGDPGCSFTVTVVDNTPPAIICPPAITVGTTPGKNTAVVDYPIATATDACGVTNVVCLPPSGSTFPLGASTVNCTARDAANNATTCSFTVTVNDTDAPVIKCPNNITMTLPSTQTMVVVTYPLPTVVDNLPGVTVSCTPPSGSVFPLGVTAVVCVAADARDNRSTCGFSISLTGGPPLLDIIIPNGKPALEFGTDKPTPVKRKNKNRATGPCAAFTVVNRSFSRLDLTLDTIRRIGSEVDNGHISDAKESDTYSLSIIESGGLETPLEIGEAVSLPLDGQVNFCLRFSPLLPGVAGSNTQLLAPQAIPDLVNSRVTFLVAGGTTLSVNVNAIVETALHLINPNNPRKPPTLTFMQSGDEFSVAFAVHDANANVSRAKYEFLDGGGAVIAGPFEVELTEAIRGRNLVRGQSFTVTQRFSGANSNRNVSGVRMTVFDGETSVTSDTIRLSGAAASGKVQAASILRFEPVMPAVVRMKSARP